MAKKMEAFRNPELFAYIRVCLNARLKEYDQTFAELSLTHIRLTKFISTNIHSFANIHSPQKRKKVSIQKEIQAGRSLRKFIFKILENYVCVLLTTRHQYKATENDSFS